MQYKTRGIIIRRRNFGEADRILTIFTVDHGKISAIAKGVRKTLSHLGGHMELFYTVDLIIAEGKNLDIITGAEVVEDLPNLRQNLLLTGDAYYVAELADKLIDENLESKKIFELIRNTFIRINKDNNHLILNYFELQLLLHLGHKPEIATCVKCTEKLDSSNLFWSSSLGGVTCKKCSLGVYDSLSVNPDIIKIMRLIINEDISIVDKLNIDSSLQQELEKIIDDFLGYVSEKTFLSKNFIKGKI